MALEQIEPRLAAYRPDEVSQRVAPRRAAVAAVLRYDGASPQVLLMKRVERQTDRWSGHVSFPGGRAEPEDATLVHTAIRETREELGVDLSQTARRIGQLDDTMAVARGKVIPMAIRPYVFVQTEAAEVILGDEAESHFWLPLDQVASGALDDTMTYKLGPVPMQFPCWRWGGYTIWGLTHKMLTGFVKVVRR